MATLSENIFINAKIGGSNRGNYVITPKIPDGLAAAVESLTREVIRHHPPDIYVFAAQHFSNLLQLRDQNYPKINRHHSQPILYDSSSSSVSSSCQVTRESPCDWQPYHHYHKKISKRSNPNYYSQYERSRDFPVVITEHHHHHHHHQRRKSRDMKTQSPSVISNDEMLAKDIKTKLKKNRISSRERSESMRSNKAVTTSMTNLSMNKVKDYVVNKFSQSSSFDEPLQPLNYVAKVQDVIDATEPIINEKLKIFRETKSLSRQSTHSQTQDLADNNLNNNSNALEARLNETHNILKDISSCFPPRSNKNRPHSADFVASRRRKYNEATTDELEAMLHETHNLLQGISSSLLKENNLRKFKHGEDHLPSVQSTAVKDSVKVNDNKSGSFALPPVVTTSSSSSSIANDDQLPKVEKVKQDLTLPVLIPAVVDNSDVADEVEIEEITEAKEEEIKEECCYVLTEDNDKSEIPSNVTTVIIPDRAGSINEQEIQADPLLDSFGEIVVAQPIEPAISINDLVDPDDLMMKNKVRVIKQDLQCINEEEGGEDSRSSRTETGEQENQAEIESDHELKVVDYQKEEMTSSAKETSVETEVGSPKSLDGRGETEQSSGDGGDVGESITDMPESSSNEAKETTVTDNCTTEPLIQSLSLDEPVRPFVPELNLDSLQDITVSSFKLTPTDDESEQPEDNEISKTLIESADVLTTATVDNSSEKIEGDICSLQVVLEADKSDKDAEEISLEAEKVSGGFNEADKVDEVLEEHSDKEDKQEPDGENDMAKFNRALIVIQAGNYSNFFI